MKNIHFLLLAMTALAIGACSPLTEPAEEVLQYRGELIFNAEHKSSPETKTVVQSNGKSVWWNAHEEISIFYGDSEGSKFTSTNDAPVAKALFKGSLESFTGETESGEPNSFWAIYPYDADSSCDGSSVTTTLPANQTAKAGTFADRQWLTVAKSYGLALSFKNVCSGFYFTVLRPGIIKATFKGNNNETLAGKIKITTNANGIPVIQEVLSGQKEIILTAPQGETFTVGEKYYFTFLPQTFTKGFTVTLETATEKGVVSIDKSVQFNRSDINWRLQLDDYITELTVDGTSYGCYGPDYTDWRLPPNLKKLTITGTGSNLNFDTLYGMPQGCEIYGTYATSDHACWIVNGKLKLFSMPQSFLDNNFAYVLPSTVTSIDNLGVFTISSGSNYQNVVVLPGNISGMLGSSYYPLFLLGAPSTSFSIDQADIICESYNETAILEWQQASGSDGPFVKIYTDDQIPTHGQSYSFPDGFFTP